MKLAVILKLFAAETGSDTGKRVKAKREQASLSSLPVCARSLASYDRRIDAGGFEGQRKNVDRVRHIWILYDIYCLML